MNRSIFLHAAAAAVFALTAGNAHAQYNSNVTLRIGDAAPPIKVQTWVRGQPVTAFEKGKVYVLDFWATWCGGCIMAFPHISAVADKYKDRVSFSSISTGEEYGELKGKDPAPGIRKFLETPPAQKLRLSVAVDGMSNTMWNTWIKPLRRQGLPTTYVIDQEGKIAWVDVNIDHLEWVLDQVMAKKWDRNKAAAIMQQRDAIDDMMMAGFRSKDAAEKKKGVQSMLSAAESFEKQFPDRKDAVAFYKFMALMELDRSRLAPVMEQIAANPRSRYINISDTAGLATREKDLPKPAYAAAVKLMERCLANPHPQPNTCGKNAMSYARLAQAYTMAGDRAKAAASGEKAVALAKEEKLPDDQMKMLQETLATTRSESAR